MIKYADFLHEDICYFEKERNKICSHRGETEVKHLVCSGLRKSDT